MAKLEYKAGKMTREITKIVWGCHNEDVHSLGETVTMYRCCKAEINPPGKRKSCVKEIVEVTPTVYDICYHSGKVLRVFNPNSVEYLERK